MVPSQGWAGRLSLPKRMESFPSIRLRVGKLVQGIDFRCFGFAQHDGELEGVCPGEAGGGPIQVVLSVAPGQIHGSAPTHLRLRIRRKKPSGTELYGSKGRHMGLHLRI